MNSLIKTVIGEATALSGPAGVAQHEPPPYPPEHPRGAVQAVTGQPPAAGEERHEAQIGNQILQAISQMLPMTRRDKMVGQIERLAKQLVGMH